MTKKQISDLLEEVEQFYDQHKRKGLRLGQVLFNVLERKHKDVAEKIRGTELDPYYDDSKSLQLINHLLVNK